MLLPTNFPKNINIMKQKTLTVKAKKIFVFKKSKQGFTGKHDTEPTTTMITTATATSGIYGL
jgi:hypothetical protein